MKGDTRRALAFSCSDVSEVPSTQGLMHKLLYTPKCKLAATSYSRMGMVVVGGDSGSEYDQEGV